jgi:hypothetical protein
VLYMLVPDCSTVFCLSADNWRRFQKSIIRFQFTKFCAVLEIGVANISFAHEIYYYPWQTVV